MTDIVPVERITDKIYLLRGKKVLMDRDFPLTSRFNSLKTNSIL